MSNDPQDAIPEAMRSACDFEGELLAAGYAVRERSKTVYGSDLLDARMLLMAALAASLKVKNGVPGKTDESISHRLVLMATLIQGMPATETLISEGQYAKAAAALKQDYEILARINEVTGGVARPGKTPNAKFAPSGSQRIYGDLNTVAHPSNQEALNDLLDKLHSGDVHGVSPTPALNANAARGLYEVHVFTLLHAVREQLTLLNELYPEDFTLFRPAIQLFLWAVEFATKAGFTVEREND